jgi:hypothetical protein
MKCDSTCLNHNSLVSQKKVVTKDVIIIKGVYGSMILSFTLDSIKFFHFAQSLKAVRG